MNKAPWHEESERLKESEPHWHDFAAFKTWFSSISDEHDEWFSALDLDEHVMLHEAFVNCVATTVPVEAD